MQKAISCFEFQWLSNHGKFGCSTKIPSSTTKVRIKVPYVVTNPSQWSTAKFCPFVWVSQYQNKSKKRNGLIWKYFIKMSKWIWWNLARGGVMGEDGFLWLPWSISVLLLVKKEWKYYFAFLYIWGRACHRFASKLDNDNNNFNYL